MDVIHHAAIGGIGMLALSAGEQEVSGIAFMVASATPDLDVAFMAGGKRAFLRNHQGPTHSVLLAPVIALAVVAPLAYLLGFDPVVYLAALAGLLIHTGLDLTNTYGIRPLWPLSTRRVSLDAVFFIDAPWWIMTAAFYLIAFLADAMTAFIIYVSTTSIYLALKLALRRKAMTTTGCDYCVPSAWNPFEFFVLKQEGEAVRTWQCSALAKTIKEQRSYDYPGEEIMNLARTSEVFNDMAAIAKFLHVTEVERTDDGAVTITARDLATRNFGGRFATTTLKFDPEGNLVHEMADI